jgi:hypothetical protein
VLRTRDGSRLTRRPPARLLKIHGHPSALKLPNGRAREVIAARQQLLDLAHVRHPERFVRKSPMAPLLPEAVWINRSENHRMDSPPDALENAVHIEGPRFLDNLRDRP